MYPKAPLIGIGFSLGANVLTRYLAEEGEKSRLVAGCALACVRVPFPSRRLFHTHLVLPPYRVAVGRGGVQRPVRPFFLISARLAADKVWHLVWSATLSTGLCTLEEWPRT